MAARMAKIQILRRIVLGTLLIGLTILTILHQKLQGIPSIDALCPFGGLETLFKYLAGGEFIKKIEPGNIVLFGGVVVIAIVLSRFFCGWFCAFGALQAVFGWLGKKIFRRHFTVPPRVDRYLRWIKYPVLAAIVYFTWKTGELVIRPYDPLAAFGHLSAGLSAVWAEFAVGLVLLVATLLFPCSTSGPSANTSAPWEPLTPSSAAFPSFGLSGTLPRAFPVQNATASAP